MEISYHGTIAAMALLMLFPLSMVLFGTMKPARAATLLAFGAVLYGPEHAYFKFPLFPHLTKENLPYMFMILAAIMFAPNRFFKNMPGLGPELILFLSLFAAVMTGNTNPDPLVYGGWMTITLPGMNIKDSFALGLSDVFRMAVPFMIGRVLFETREDLRFLARGIAGLILVYSLWIVIELKMSPQMNVWVYGYFAHSEFAQVYRWGGFRPMVFMAHGLALSLLVCHACIVLAGFKRAGEPAVPQFSQVKTNHLLWYLLVILVLCKSSGSILYALIIVPLMLRSSLKTVARVATVLAVLSVAYPYLRAQNLVPVDSLVDAAEMLSADRAESLQFRFTNEAALLEKAQQKLWWGWGSYGRNSIYDSEMGKEITIADGAWIILLGIRGVVGMLMLMGVPAFAAVYSARKLKKIPHEQDQWLMAGLTCMLAVGMFDLIPNGLFNNYPYFLAGALYGLAKSLTSPKALRAARGAGAVPSGESGKGKKKRKKKRKGRRDVPSSTPPIWSVPPAPPSVAAQDMLFQDPPPPSPVDRDVEDALFEAPTESRQNDRLDSAPPDDDGSASEDDETILLPKVRRDDDPGRSD